MLIVLQKLLIILQYMGWKVCVPKSHCRGFGKLWERRNKNWEKRWVNEPASMQASQPDSSGKKDEATVKVPGRQTPNPDRPLQPTAHYHVLGQGFALHGVRDLFLLSHSDPSIKAVQ